MFKVEKTYSAEYAMDCRFHYQNPQVLFSKSGTETLFSNLERWLKIGRLRINQGWAPAGRRLTRRRHGHAAELLARVSVWSDSGRSKPNRKHRGEEKEATSPVPIVRATDARTELVAAAVRFSIRWDPKFANPEIGWLPRCSWWKKGGGGGGAKD